MENTTSRTESASRTLKSIDWGLVAPWALLLLVVWPIQYSIVIFLAGMALTVAVIGLPLLLILLLVGAKKAASSSVILGGLGLWAVDRRAKNRHEEMMGAVVPSLNTPTQPVEESRPSRLRPLVYPWGLGLVSNKTL